MLENPRETTARRTRRRFTKTNPICSFTSTVMARIADEFGRNPAKMPFDFTEIVGALAPRAVFINAPLRDGNFEVSGVKDCVAAAMPVYKLHEASVKLEAVYPDAGHDFPPDIREKAYAFIDRQLKPRP